MMKHCQSKINQSTQKKGEYKEQNGRTHIQEDKRTTYRGLTTRGTQVPKPPPVARSISNKEPKDNEKG
jgi:hypothetical protein